MGDRLAEATEAARNSYHSLVLLVGPHGSGKSAALRSAAKKNGWPLINLGVELARLLVETPRPRRSIEAQDAISELVSAQPAPVVALDNIEVLFDPSLKLQPLELLKQLSRSRTIVAAWPGAAGDGLTYAEPGRCEYGSFDPAGLTVLPIQSVTGW